MNSAHFSFYGINLKVSTIEELPEILQNLKEDFGYFQVEDDLPTLHIEFIFKGTGTKTNKGQWPILLKNKMYRASGLGPHRVCDYGAGHFIVAENATHLRRFKVFGDNTDLLYEIGYMAILSAVGEALDKKGYHRVHALGVNFNSQGVLCVLPPGGGKSSMAVLLRDHSNTLIFSDEIPLVRDGVLYPFPIRMALQPQVAQALNIDSTQCRVLKRKIFPAKVLIPIKKEKVAQPRPLEFLLVGKRVASAGKIKPLGRATCFKELTRSMVVGLGLPQMAEHMIRANNLSSLAQIAFSRTKEAIGMLKSQKFLFEIGPDARANAKTLTDFLESHL